MNHPPAYPMNGPPFPQQYPPPPPPPGTPQAPQYAYPVHHSPYPPHYYPQYPPQMMMYGPPPPAHPAHDPHDDSASAGAKRKRKSAGAAGRGKDKSDDEAASPDLTAAQQKAAALELKKRTKTQRACDSCRSRKIRCDILSDAEPPKCQHCKQYSFDCTFFLPITETRFKKKRLEEENADNKSPLAEKRDISVFGPTSTAHLLHSQASISSRIYEGYDTRYHHTFEVSKSGDGLIRVEKPTQTDQQMSLPKPVDLHIEPQMVEQLLNAYFAEVAPLLPVITQAEFLANPAPAPVLLYSMCLVAAARRDVPQSVFDSIRYAVNGVIKADDVLSTPSMANVQALLILCMTGDCHSQFVPTALSAMWARLGTAIRMAQDLGLHRAELVKQDIELRRRVWGACLIADYWTSLVYGFPYMIDIRDCDVRLPSSGDAKEIYMDELVRLSIIGGRVVKTIYSPSGLMFVNDETLYKLLADIESWKANLPEALKFRGVESSQSAGILHLLYTSVCMIFWRVFMRISYSCPAHLKFGLTVEQWTSLVALTGDSIDWLDTHERVYDVWLLVAYAATSFAFVQYHTWVRRQDPDAVARLRKLRDCVRRWEGSISPDHMSARRKARCSFLLCTAEIITLLFEATQGPQLPLEAPALNPTGGVKGKRPAALDYKPDPTRPGGGVFVAHKDAQGDFQDVPAGMVITEGEGQGEGRQLSPSAFAPPPEAGSTPASAPRRFMRSGNNAQHAAAADANRDASAPAPGGAAMVNLTPLTGSGGRGAHSNVNPAMNVGVGAAGGGSGEIQVMNVLDGPQAVGALAEFQMTDFNFLEGIPGGMFDWGQWDTFFSRINHAAAPGEQRQE
ncbi:fungal-specific transcription factor domain-containing protein [Mycena belliarum]|uniref:Fungal-specific transcription factor domain-containing protein n=1 Tax=Mycena belliarum TaxID=1033014 RepID=A0AAD6UFV2_9AGAR|nr:fungal-specific transcription factor domain-containing protein [Mycena belliae]